MNDHGGMKSDTKPRGNNSNVINVTTSETMRLDGGGDRTNLHLQPMGGTGGGGQGYQQKKKNSSFQITSITSRLSNDAGEDSADDTEDISDIADTSRVTDFDQETPSYSEDYSKTEEVFFGPAPVIPTSSQYGITALVQQTGSGGLMTARLPQGVTVNVTEGGIALAKADGESDEVDHWQNRFKIVKIDSNEPFKRGRWICLDFMDSPAVNASSAQKKDESMTVVINSVGDKDDVGDHQPQTVLQVPVPVTQQNQTTTQNQSHPVAPQYQVPQVAANLASSAQPTQGSVPMQQQSSPHMPAPTASQAASNMQYPSQGAPMQGQLQPTMSQGYANTSQTPQASVHPSPSAQTPPQAQPPLQPQLQQQQQQQAAPSMQQTSAASQSGVQPTIQTTNIPQGAVTQAGVQQSMVPPSSHAPPHQSSAPQSSMAQPSMNTSISQQGIPAQTVNIPQNVAQPGVIGHGGMATQPHQPNVMSGIPSQGVSMAQPVVTHQGVPSQSVMSQPQPGVQQVPQQNLPQSVPTQNQQQINPSMPSQSMPGSQPMQHVTASQQMTSGQQQLPVTQQHSSTVGQANLINQSTMGSSQQVPVATPATSVQPSSGVPQASHGSVPSTGVPPTPATTPAQPQAHLNMGDSQQSSQSQQTTQQQQPPTNLEVIPLVQPIEDANATPPAPGAQPEDTERYECHRMI